MAHSVAVKTSGLALKASAFGLIVMASPALAAGDSKGGLPQLDFTTWPTQIFWLVVSFALAYVLMWRVVTPRIASVLEDRHDRLDDDMQRARQAADEAESMRVAFEKTLADARAEATEKTRLSTAAAVAEAEKKNDAAAKRLATKIGKAEAKIMEARDNALTELDDVAVTSAIDAAAALAGVKITKTDAKKAVKAAAKAMPAMEQN
ncbi:MAG: F0F1 ATP synthase subunit B' [Alphaproteobacteria bacterium]|nr:F0F1 ATP synthase subunit B' [Alphaproteobacteria bacterium]